MQLLIQPQRSGKTTELIKQSAANWWYIVCIDRAAVDHTMMLARHHKLIIPMPITFEEFITRRYYGKGIAGFLIDDLDMFFRRFTTVPIHIATISAEIRS